MTTNARDWAVDAWRLISEECLRHIAARAQHCRKNACSACLTEALAAAYEAGRADATPPDGDGALRAFMSRWTVTDVNLSAYPGDHHPWRMVWKRIYPDGVESDERVTWGRTMRAAVEEAVAWEAKNDEREPEHAGEPCRHEVTKP